MIHYISHLEMLNKSNMIRMLIVFLICFDRVKLHGYAILKAILLAGLTQAFKVMHTWNV